MAVMFALSAPAVFGAIGLASDFAVAAMKSSALQGAADAAALAAAKELSVASSTDANVKSSAANYVVEELRGKDDDATTVVTIDRKKGSVTVAITENWMPMFAQFLNAGITPISTTATAKLAGTTNICVLSLTSAGLGAIIMSNNSKITANDCGLYSNSSNAYSIYLGDASLITSPLICSGGGVYNNGGTPPSSILTDCPPTKDPLASRVPPTGVGCTNTNYIITSGSAVLQPGTYCGGINISGTAKVTFNPGTYIVKDGLFIIKDTAIATGTNVGFYLTGPLSLISFTGNATINFSGAETGNMAGLLFFEDPKSGPLRVHHIAATHADTLTGTIYLPKGNLLVDPNASVGQNSAYTAIVVNRLIVQAGPSLVLNSNYSATQVPVPTGIQVTGTVVLSN